MEKGECNGMLFPGGRSPQGPAVHGPQNSFQVVVKQISPLELIVAPAAFWLKVGKPYGDPALHPLVICLPGIRRVHP